jgi:hypothetical protein
VVVVAVSVIFPPARTIADTSGPDQPTVRFEAVPAFERRQVRRGVKPPPWEGGPFRPPPTEGSQSALRP